MKLIDNVIGFSLRNTLLVVLGALLLVAGGLVTTRQMDIDVFPDLTAPTVVVMTDANGMAAEEVEKLVTFPIETAMNGATDVRRVRSVSTPGASFVWVEFDWGADVYRARQVVSEKMVTLAEALPEGVTPVLAPQSSVMGEILFIGLQSDTTSMADLRTLADWVVKPAILATGGVSQVTVIGGDYKQYQIIADPERMAELGVTMNDIDAVGRSFSTNTPGGVMRSHGNEYMVVGRGRSADVDQLGESLVKMNGDIPVTLSDVAEVRTGVAMKMGHASQNAKPAVILSVSKQPNINTLEVTEAIERNLKGVAETLPKDVNLDTTIFRQADFIETSVNNVGRALIEGAIFVVIVLFIFLNSFRTTLISIIAIPLSLLGTVIVLHMLGMNINTMTLGGMCIAIGSLVDDAIIDVENVYKRLRHNHALPKEERKSDFTVVLEASKEIRASILNATFIIIVAFIPLFFLSGMEGRMLKPLGTAYIVSLFMSLIVAMTVTPLLSKLLLSSHSYLEKNKKEGCLTQWIGRKYMASLRWTMGHKKWVMGVTGVVFGCVLGLAFTLGQSFLPEFNEGSATIAAVASPGVSLDVSNDLGNMIEKTLLEIPEVTHTSRRTGRGELDEHSQMTNSAEIDVNFRSDGRSKEEIFDDMRHRMAQVPGIAATIGQPLGHRIDHMLSGTRANIAIKIFGPELPELFLLGNRIKDAVAGIPGVVDLSVEQQTETPQLEIKANRAAMAAHGVTMADFNTFVERALSGEKIGEIYEGERSFDVVVRLADPYRTPQAVGDALVDTQKGTKVPLSEIAEIVSATGPNSVSRENVQRKLVVSANVSGRDLSGAVNDIRKAVAEKVQMPQGYRVEYGGQFENAQKATRTLVLTTLAALLVILLLLFIEFRSLKLALVILVSLPFALIGGVLAVFVTSGTLSIPAIIGFITLFGVAVRNGILLVSRYRQVSQDASDLRKTILEGSADRLNPILMTALTSALALVPLVIEADKPGNEIQSPMAMVVLGGLLTSTLLNLYILPIIFEWYAKKVNKKSKL